MKKVILLMLVLIPVFCIAQEIKKNEKDEFTGAQVIETNWERILTRMSEPSCIYARIRIINGVELLDFKVMTDGACVISPSNKLMLKDVDGNIHSLTPTETFSGTLGGGSIGIMGSKGWGIGVTYKGDLSFLKKTVITKLRIYESSGYYEVDLKKKGQDLLSGLYNVIYNTNSKLDLDKYK